MALNVNRFRRWFVLAAIFMVGALIVAMAPAAILADDDTETRSVESFQPITISHESLLDLEALADDLDPLTMLLIYIQLQDLGEFDTDISEDSFREVGDLDEVIEHLDGAFSVPDYLPSGFDEDPSRFGVGEAGYASATLNVRAARSISQLLDIDPSWLPSPTEYETVTMSLELPPSGLVAWESRFQTLVVGQIAIPHFEIPDVVDLEALRESILADPRLPDEIADQLAAIENWEETVPVPVPEGAEYTDLEIDGGAGFMLSMMDEGAAVVWEVDGTLYFVAGNLPADELQQVAESMQ